MTSASKISIAAIIAVLLLAGALSVKRERPSPAPRNLPKETIAVTTAVPSRQETDIEAELVSLRRENQRLKETLDRMAYNAGDGATAKVNRLRDVLSSLPEQGIPELRLANEDDWYAAVDGPLESVEDYRSALSKLRHRAERRFATLVQPALRTYIDTRGKFPESTAELKGLLAGSPIDESMLLRYKIAPASEVRNVKMGGEWIITQANRVDSDYDPFVVIGPQGHGSFGRSPPQRAALEPVLAAFKEANPGVPPNDPAQLLPYAKTPEQRAEVERLTRSMMRR